jgi:hypothetical protein
MTLLVSRKELQDLLEPDALMRVVGLASRFPVLRREQRRPN